MTNGQTLRDHISAIHLKLKPFVCHIDKCGKKFGLKKNMISHQKRRHLRTESNENNVTNEDNDQTDDEDSEETDEENDDNKTIVNSDVSILHKNGFAISCRQSSHQINGSKGLRNGSKSCSSEDSSPSNPKRNYDKKNDKNHSNNYLFECNFIGCLFKTFIWEEIADHFVDHWGKMIPFDEMKD